MYERKVTQEDIRHMGHGHLFGGIPRDVIEELRALGAVKAGCHVFFKWSWYGERPHLSTFTDLVYFFREDNVEVGYWSCLSQFFGNMPFLFGPEGRIWSREFLESVIFQELPPPLVAA